MTYHLVGSLTSPYVRRLRLYLNDAPYELELIDYLTPEGATRLSALNPIKRIPVLIADGKVLWENRVIAAYLQRTLGKAAMTWDDENHLSAIDALQDQLVQIFLMGKLKPTQPVPEGYLARANDRKAAILSHLSHELKRGSFQRWEYPAMALYSLLDWSLFRNTLSKEEIGSDLLSFHTHAAHQPKVRETDPRLA